MLGTVASKKPITKRKKRQKESICEHYQNNLAMQSRI